MGLDEWSGMFHVSDEWDESCGCNHSASVEKDSMKDSLSLF